MTQKRDRKNYNWPKIAEEELAKSEDPRLYSFALNFLFNFQDPGKKILRSKLITAMNDYIEHFSLKYSAVQKLADEAIAEFREKSKTIPEFKSAIELTSKTESIPSTSVEVHSESQDEIEKESKILREVQEPKKIGKLTSDFRKLPGPSFPKKFLKAEYQDILTECKNQESNIKHLCKVIGAANSTIYDRVQRLIEWGYLYEVPNSYPKIYSLTKPAQNLFSNFPKSLRQGALSGNSESVPDSVLSPNKDHANEIEFSENSNSLRNPKNFSKNSTETPSFAQIKELINNSVSENPEITKKTQRKRRKSKKKLRKYPIDHIWWIKSHKLSYKFNILQQSKYLTYYCKTDRGVLGKETWCSIQALGPKNNPSWYKYHGTITLNEFDYYVMFTRENVIVNFDMIFRDNPLDAIIEILDRIFEIKAHLEDTYSIENSRLLLGSVNPEFIALCLSQHFGLLYEPLAVACQRLGITFENDRLRIDVSNGISETETHHKQWAADDMQFLWNEMDKKIRQRYSLFHAKDEIKENAENIAQHGKNIHETAEIQEKAAKQIEEISKNQLWSISGQRHQTEVQQSFINGSMHIIEQNLALQERVKALEQHLPKISKMEDFFKEREMFDPSRTLVEKLQKILEKNPGITRKQVIKHFGFKKGSIGPTIGRLAKRVNLKEENRRLLIID